ncbi:hypothetical protein BNJ_00438 [Kaumoebavirus]|uniref:hypothetical protein n=1 Tax=Kaumoebavirus TaxID=1859492 RepID=UPI0009C33287|nr:hypothetical protein BNJ_00438 [Kaumoebavirus]ARA72250.1 hypothetical protein BNJ_00438 [Kaumoebavirus]
MARRVLREIAEILDEKVPKEITDEILRWLLWRPYLKDVRWWVPKSVREKQKKYVAGIYDYDMLITVSPMLEYCLRKF